MTRSSSIPEIVFWEQLDALTGHGYDRLFTEKESGKRGVDRPQWRVPD